MLRTGLQLNGSRMPWIDVADRATLARRSWMEAEAGRAAILLYDVAGTVYATAAICPHHAAWLSQGAVHGEYVDCPRHQGQFHIPTGQQTGGPACDKLQTYPVRVIGDRVEVEV
jgi:nitrite reductase/ring-hydroxylating ferredoxin subunit